jgi:hypothetical protein
MKDAEETSKQNVTVSLSRQTLQKARVLAARRATSIRELLAEQIEALVGEDESYERAKRQALALLDKGFPLGGVIRGTRDEWHER